VEFWLASKDSFRVSRGAACRHHTRIGVHGTALKLRPVAKFTNEPGSNPARSSRMEALRIGFIGGGNMATALIAGLLDKGGLASEQVRASDVDAAQLKALTERFGITTVTDNLALIEWAECLVLAVKPQSVAQALLGCREKFTGDKLLISICAGVPILELMQRVGDEARVVRAMPNTPALISQGATGLAAGPHATERDRAFALELFTLVGKCWEVSEAQLDAVTGLSGSGPAYVLLFAEALADGGVRQGLPREISRQLALQTVLGTATLAQGSGVHMAELRDRVTSPAGTTIEGLMALEGAGVRAAVIDAVSAATERSRELGALSAARTK
jgi:pyrroline-5-carboxylate reductase